jgi:hypothetical protein
VPTIAVFELLMIESVNYAGYADGADAHLRPLEPLPAQKPQQERQGAKEGVPSDAARGRQSRKAGGKLPPPTGRQGIRASSRAVKRKKEIFISITM